jgi:hypothetical protein
MKINEKERYGKCQWPTEETYCNYDDLKKLKYKRE